MSFLSYLLGFCAIGAGVQAQNPARYHPCLEYPTKVSRLSACATASPFCSSLLGGTATFTRTNTITSTVAMATSTTTTTITTTSTDPLDTSSIDTDSTFTVSAYAATTTVTTTEDSCAPTADNKKARRAAVTNAAVARPSSSCGIDRAANPSQVSGACQCVLASSTQVTVTSTMGGDGTATATSTVFTTVTVPIATVFNTPTTTISSGTSTTTACVTPTGIPDASVCNPSQTCGGYTFYTCDSDGSNDCTCDQDTEGNGVCIHNGACYALPVCASTSDCPSGYACVTGDCCNANTCLPLDGGCFDPAPGLDDLFRNSTKHASPIDYAYSGGFPIKF